MKTTIDIPKEELEELIRQTKAKTKKEAVIKAIREYNRRQRLARVAQILGTFEDFISPEELQRMRKEK